MNDTPQLSPEIPTPRTKEAEFCVRQSGKPLPVVVVMASTCAEIERELHQAKEENSKLKRDMDVIDALLKDPNAVRINMLMGKIAYTHEMLRHVMGEVDLKEERDTLQQQVERMREALNMANEDYKNGSDLNYETHLTIEEALK